MALLRLHVAVAGVAVPIEVHHTETVESITRRTLENLFGENAPPPENCQMHLGEQTLDMATKVHEIDLETGVHLSLTLPF